MGGEDEGEGGAAGVAGRRRLEGEDGEEQQRVCDISPLPHGCRIPDFIVFRSCFVEHNTP